MGNLKEYDEEWCKKKNAFWNRKIWCVMKWLHYLRTITLHIENQSNFCFYVTIFYRTTYSLFNNCFVLIFKIETLDPEQQKFTKYVRWAHYAKAFKNFDRRNQMALEFLKHFGSASIYSSHKIPTKERKC